MEAKGLAEIVGRVKDTNIPNNASENLFGGAFQKFCIELDTTKAITPGFFIERQGRKPVWTHFKYVKLPGFCYNCGRLSHESSPNKTVDGTVLFGTWLKAEDHSWNVPEWPKNSGCKPVFITVVEEELGTMSDVSDTVNPSPELETLPQDLRQSGALKPPEVTVAKPRCRFKRNNFSKRQLSDCGSDNSMDSTNKILTERQNLGLFAPNEKHDIQTFDPGLENAKSVGPI